MKIKDTAKSRNLQKELFRYQDWYEKAKGEKPPVIRLSRDQLDALGVDDGFHLNGSKLILDKI